MDELVTLFGEYLPWLFVLGGVLVMGVGWLLLRSLLKMTMRLTLLGCAGILVLGCIGLAIASYF